MVVVAVLGEVDVGRGILCGKTIEAGCPRGGKSVECGGGGGGPGGAGPDG